MTDETAAAPERPVPLRQSIYSGERRKTVIRDLEDIGKALEQVRAKLTELKEGI